MSKISAVARAQLTHQMLTLLKKYLPTQQKTFSCDRSLPMKLTWKYLNKILNKSLGDDSIGARIIQLCSKVFSENQAEIYNNSINTKGEYHKQLKIANVIALF